MNKNREKFLDSLYIVWTISAKDILDSIKNLIVISQIIAVLFILLTVKALSWAFQPQYIPVMVFDPGSSHLAQVLDDSPDFGVQYAESLEDLQQVIGNMGFGLGPEVGIEIPHDFDDQNDDLEINGYVSWANRTKAPGLKAEIESALLEVTGQPFIINLAGNIISPPPEIGLFGGLITMFAVTIILLMGVMLVPNLLLEEKQNRTMDALLVSPASISQVVIGKAIAGFFYILVTAAIVYLIYWTGVVSWGISALFVIGAGLFSVAVGLLFGIIFNSQQEMTGWLSLTIVIITGSIFVVLIGLDMPAYLETLIKW
ncbi:MAG: ABC transporter permease, partial [Chloroflexi bacterium]|nr:ABC transporter permease [Chloroflexota bacterium]